MRSEIAPKLTLDQIRYSQVWEDHRLLDVGLDLGPTDDVLSICSAGCNVLSMLLQEPRSITAIDMSPAQVAVLELKLAGIRNLSHLELASLIGVRADHDRRSLYRRIQDDLPPHAREYWDAHLDTLEHGFLQEGRLERYFEIFRKEHLSNVWGSDVPQSLLTAPDLDTQRKRFAAANTEPFREIFSWYFDRHMLETHGRDPAQFRHVAKGQIGAHFHERFSYACTQMPLPGNFYMEAFLTGKQRDLTRSQPYLHPDNFNRLKKLVGRVRVVVDELERFVMDEPAGRFNKANLSDIFEYMSEELSTAVFRALATRFRRGGRLAHWELLVPRSRPEALADRLVIDEMLSRRLWLRDRSWFYQAFHVDVVQ